MATDCFCPSLDSLNFSWFLYPQSEICDNDWVLGHVIGASIKSLDIRERITPTYEYFVELAAFQEIRDEVDGLKSVLVFGRNSPFNSVQQTENYDKNRGG